MAPEKSDGNVWVGASEVVEVASETGGVVARDVAVGAMPVGSTF
jgi:hypothetical protein